MPVVYNYLGIKIGFFTNEHEPIHVHAMYDGAEVKIILHVKDGYVYRVTYQNTKGTFNRSKLTSLKEFISKYKMALYFAWIQCFQNNKNNERLKIKTVVITKKIK